MSSNVLVWFLLISLFSYISCSKFFFRGREKGGNVGSPVINVPLQELPGDKWFTQILDHFTPTDTRTWQQRYFVNDTFYQRGGPVFLMIGGEGPAGVGWMVTGAWITFAEKYGALCIQLEHRYYGDSRPTGDLSVKNLQYLSSEQTLADIAYFIESMNEKLELDVGTKWITFGGSYAGSLSAWMRAKYPHLVQGAVSTSGPLLAIVDFKDYFKVVRESLLTGGEECVASTEKANDEFTEVLYQEPTKIEELFKLCQPVDLNNSDDISTLYESIADNFAGVVQYNKDNRQSASEKVRNITINTICSIMTNDTLGSPLLRLAEFNSVLLDAYNSKCLDHTYSSMVTSLQASTWTSSGSRQWTYQTCTEFGFFQTSDLNSTQALFGDKFPVEFFIKLCSDVYGSKFGEKLLNYAIDRSNMMFGGFDIKADNIVFVHGSIDPWHALGITKTLNEKSPAIYIEGTAHCADMYATTPNDPPALIAAREEISRLIGVWLESSR